MTYASHLAATLMCAMALLLIAAQTANLDPDKPLWPTSDERSDLLGGLIACALTFVAGLLL